MITFCAIQMKRICCLQGCPEAKVLLLEAISTCNHKSWNKLQILKLANRQNGEDSTHSSLPGFLSCSLLFWTAEPRHVIQLPTLFLLLTCSPFCRPLIYIHIFCLVSTEFYSSSLPEHTTTPPGSFPPAPYPHNDVCYLYSSQRLLPHLIS